MLKFLKKRSKNEKGDATLISLIVALPIVLLVLFTLIDSGLYFMNSQSISSAARDAARTVAIYGGNGNSSKYTTIEKAYSVGTKCTSDTKKLTASGTSTECALVDLLGSSPMLSGVKINKVSCGPPVTTGIGQDVTCTVQWDYSGIPGSAISFIKSPTTGKSPFESNTTIGVSQSEVQLKTKDLVKRT